MTWAAHGWDSNIVGMYTSLKGNSQSKQMSTGFSVEHGKISI